MAYVVKLNHEQSADRTVRSRQYGYVHLLVFGAILILGALMLRACPFRLGVVVGKSMTPTLQPNNVFMLDRSFYEHTVPTRGEIVVAKANGETCVKRVAAGPGEDLWLIEYAPDGRGSAYTEVVRPHDVSRVQGLIARYPRLGRLHHARVPDGKVFLIGDAQNISLDSRSYGPIPISQVMGRVFPVTANHSQEMPRYSPSGSWRT